MNSIHFTATVDIEAAQGKTPTARLTAYSGGLMRPQGIPTIVAVDGVKLPDAVPLLGDHRNELDAVLGSVQPTSDGRAIYGDAVLVGNSAASDLVELARGGVPLQASVGLKITKARWQAPGPFALNGRQFQLTERTRIVEESELREISIVPLGADSEAHAAIAASQNAPTKENTMDAEQLLADERARIKKIDSLCSQVRTPHVDELRAAAIDGELSVEELATKLLADLRAAHSQPVPSPLLPARRDADPGKTLEAALLLRSGQRQIAEKAFDEYTLDAADALSKLPTPEMIRRVFNVAGPMSNSELLASALRGDLRAAGTSTTSLPQALGNAMHRSLVEHYREASASWRAFCGVRLVNDFRTHTDIQPALRGSFLPVAKDGEIKSHEPGEQAWPFSVSTYGRRFTITRVDLLNDDLGFFDGLPQQLGRAAARAVADKVYETILANPGSHWHADNGNLIPTNALGVEGLAAALATFRKRRDADGNDLDIQPRVLLVPPSLEATGRALLESIEVVPAADSVATADRPTGNVFRGMLQLAVEPRLENSDKFAGASASSWFLLAGPSDTPWITAFLGGDAPTIEYFGLDAHVEHLSVSYRAYLDFGTARGDVAASVKSTA